MSTNAQNGLIHLASQHSVEETMQRLEALLGERGITIFARVDHSGEREGRAHHATDQVAHPRQSKGRNSIDAGRSHSCH